MARNANANVESMLSIPTRGVGPRQSSGQNSSARHRATTTRAAAGCLGTGNIAADGGTVGCRLAHAHGLLAPVVDIVGAYRWHRGSIGKGVSRLFSKGSFHMQTTGTRLEKAKLGAGGGVACEGRRREVGGRAGVRGEAGARGCGGTDGEGVVVGVPRRGRTRALIVP